MKILFSFDLKDKYLKSIESSFEGIEIVKTEDPNKLIKEIKDTDILAAMLMREFDLNLVRKGKKLKWIQSWSAGVDTFFKNNSFQYLKDNEIILTSVRGIHKDSMSEQVIGYMISITRRFHDLYELQKKREWDRLKVDYLKGKNLAIFGLGAVGKEIAKKANLFKMNVMGVKRKVKQDIPYIKKIYSHKKKKEVLSKSDFVVVTLPLTDKTRGFFGYEEFEAMSKKAHFINVARGQIVKEKELIRALEEKIIAGAALDVYQKEPLDPNSKLYELDNVILTPHTSGLYPNYNKEAVSIFKKNLRAYLDNKKMINVIDPDLQY
ncbi:MAG: D-2-hydroxyacid dehydrogenase [Halanaerobiales bacterium]|nr:D-2-hydroxyacid dehydrogenase [Halanaerobiales bacterium]